MIDAAMVRGKVRLIQKDLEQLKPYQDFTFDQIASDYRTHKVVERIIEVVINEAIDINQHLVIEGGKGDLPFDFKKSFLPQHQKAPATGGRDEWFW